MPGSTAIDTKGDFNIHISGGAVPTCGGITILHINTKKHIHIKTPIENMDKKKK